MSYPLTLAAPDGRQITCYDGEHAAAVHLLTSWLVWEKVGGYVRDRDGDIDWGRLWDRAGLFASSERLLAAAAMDLYGARIDSVDAATLKWAVRGLGGRASGAGAGGGLPATPRRRPARGVAQMTGPGPSVTRSAAEAADLRRLVRVAGGWLAELARPLLDRYGQAADLDRDAAALHRWATTLADRQTAAADGSLRLVAGDVEALAWQLGEAARWLAAAGRRSQAPAGLADRLVQAQDGLRALPAHAHASPDPAVTTLGHPPQQGGR